MKLNLSHKLKVVILFITLLSLVSTLTVESYMAKANKKKKSKLRNHHSSSEDGTGPLVSNHKKSITYNNEPAATSWDGNWKLNSEVERKTEEYHHSHRLHRKQNTDPNSKSIITTSSSTPIQTVSQTTTQNVTVQPNGGSSIISTYYNAVPQNELTTTTGFVNIGPYMHQARCPEDVLYKDIQKKFKIIKLLSEFVNKDNSFRLYVSDRTNDKTYAMKLFMKGNIENCEVYSKQNAQNFFNVEKDCLNLKILNNRLYGKPPEYSSKIDKVKDKKIFEDIQFPVCEISNAMSQDSNVYYELYDLPQGEKLLDKCIREDLSDYDDTNTCIPYLKTISKSVLHAISIMNMGKKFFAHGAISPEFLYLKQTKKGKYVFIDNFAYDPIVHDDEKNKPSADDMDQLGDTLLQIIMATNDLNAIKYPITGAYDLYVKINKYFKSKGATINLKSNFLNVANDLKSFSPKVVTLEEYINKFDGSFFDFIYRLKNKKVQPINQFKEISQALKHPFIYKDILLYGKNESEDDDKDDNLDNKQKEDKAKAKQKAKEAKEPAIDPLTGKKLNVQEDKASLSEVEITAMKATKETANMTPSDY